MTNVETVLGKFTDPALPVKSIDVALFHDVIHHVENRAAYLKTLTGYLAPSGRIVVIDYEGGRGRTARSRNSRSRASNWRAG